MPISRKKFRINKLSLHCELLFTSRDKETKEVIMFQINYVIKASTLISKRKIKSSDASRKYLEVHNLKDEKCRDYSIPRKRCALTKRK